MVYGNTVVCCELSLLLSITVCTHLVVVYDNTVVCCELSLLLSITVCTQASDSYAIALVETDVHNYEYYHYTACIHMIKAKEHEFVNYHQQSQLRYYFIKFLNQPHAWFLEITSMQMLVCVCVSAPRLLKTNVK